jgi:hypothetical protein
MRLFVNLPGPFSVSTNANLANGESDLDNYDRYKRAGVAPTFPLGWAIMLGIFLLMLFVEPVAAIFFLFIGGWYPTWRILRWNSLRRHAKR